MARLIIWDDEALDYLGRVLQWIGDESVVQAENVEKGTLEKVKAITTHPERYPPDKFKKNNQGKHRAFERNLSSLRVTF